MPMKRKRRQTTTLVKRRMTKCGRSGCEHYSTDPQRDGWQWIETRESVPLKTGWWCPRCLAGIIKITAKAHFSCTKEDGGYVFAPPESGGRLLIRGAWSAAFMIALSEERASERNRRRLPMDASG